MSVVEQPVTAQAAAQADDARASEPAPVLIEARGLVKLYRMGESIVRALDGVDLTIRRGEFVAITGPSGSGKSTMMHVLGCLDRPTAGRYRLAGRDVSELSDRELAALRNRSIGFVFQTFNLINRVSALDNVAVPLFYARKSHTREPARKALERVGLAHRAHHKPGELSGGERQRVAIARAIVNDPLLLLADEPTGNLDSRTGEQILSIFHELNAQGVTIVLVTHEPDVALQAARIVQMRDGRIISDQPSSVLRAAMGGHPRGLVTLPSAEEIPQARGTAQQDAADPQAGEVRAAATPPAATREDDAALMPARVADGANGSLVAGIAAVVLMGVVFGCALAIRAMRLTPQMLQNPPQSVVVLSACMALCLLGALVAGVIAIFWGRAVLRRIRLEPGHWLGRRRARVAWWLGFGTVMTPVVLIAWRILGAAVRG